MHIKNPLSDVLNFTRSYPGVAGMVWLLAFLVSSIFVVPRHLPGLGLPELGLTAVLTLAVGTFLVHLLRQYDLALQKRIDAGAIAPVWEVDINDVRVGEIRDDYYAAIRRSVFFDLRIYMAQFLNLASVVGKLGDKLLQVIPTGIFWLAAGCLIFAPKTFFASINELQMITPERLMVWIPAFVGLLLPFAMLYFVFHALFGRVPGYLNHFDVAIGERVRRTVRCAAEGKILLYRMEVKQRIDINELEYVRSLLVKR
ncbi:hypothetical protein HA052_04515 [Chromobacterium haemolyticum]|uniref:Uncharacterized protein n=1 Tax=Chromobacterium fluminis TaxID=3044269 RepID=A0ABX0L4P2_9NEIS|nr:hypothetical protein [Chromobacterium haemolyticum]NHR04454.1 hypothetical protein [Chromobacterium haemolyticum]